MPTLPLMQMPKSKSAEEFEYLCADVLSKYYNRRFTLYGKKGQLQNGIDIYSEYEKNNYIVGQCKNYFSPNSADNLINKIKEDIKSAEKIPFHISKFIVMTSMDNHTKVQNEIANIDSDFYIELWFWDEIQQVVCSNDDLLYKYYPTINYNQQPNNVTIESLKNEFNVYMQKMNILQFVRIDPFLGMPYDLPSNVDIFYNVIKKKLDDVIVLQDEKVFKAINEFIYLLDAYNGYLSRLMYPVSNGYYSFQKFKSDEMKKEIKNTKIELDKLYSKINKGCKLFY